MRTDIDEFDDGADRPKRVDPADERYVAQQKPAQWNNTDDIDELDRIEYTIDVDELDDIDPARLPTSAWVQPTVPKSHTKVWKSTKKVGAKLKKSLKKANQSLSTSKRRSSRFLLATILTVLSAAMLVAQVRPSRLRRTFFLHLVQRFSALAWSQIERRRRLDEVLYKECIPHLRLRYLFKTRVEVGPFKNLKNKLDSNCSQ